MDAEKKRELLEARGLLLRALMLLNLEKDPQNDRKKHLFDDILHFLTKNER